MRQFFFILFALPSLYQSASAQTLTGTWEGIMSTEFIRINIIQKNEAICGYTYDYEISNPKNHCKAYFSGYYDKNRSVWILTGNQFIENSGGHILMRILLSTKNGINYKNLQASVGLNSIMGAAFNLGGEDSTLLTRISPKPTLLADDQPTCFGITLTKPLVKKQEKSTPVIKKPIISKPVTLPVIAVDSMVKQPIISPIPVVNKPLITEPKIINRKQQIFGHIPVTVKNITLQVYDNGEIDGDSVSIFYNNRLLVNRQMLSEKPILINLQLDETVSLHQITLFAENLGSIPPNTCLVVITAGDKRYEMHASSNLKENAVLIFEYTGRR